MTTSRERVLRAVNFQPVDRIPIDLGSMKASGISVRAYNRVKAKLGELRTREQATLDADAVRHDRQDGPRHAAHMLHEFLGREPRGR